MWNMILRIYYMNFMQGYWEYAHITFIGALSPWIKYLSDV